MRYLVLRATLEIHTARIIHAATRGAAIGRLALPGAAQSGDITSRKTKPETTAKDYRRGAEGAEKGNCECRANLTAARFDEPEPAATRSKAYRRGRCC